MKKGNLRKATFTKPEGSQSGGVQIFFQIRRGPNPEGFCFHKTGGVAIWSDHLFANSEGSQSGGVSILPMRKGPIFANPEGYYIIKGLR